MKHVPNPIYVLASESAPGYEFDPPALQYVIEKMAAAGWLEGQSGHRGENGLLSLSESGHEKMQIIAAPFKQYVQTLLGPDPEALNDAQRSEFMRGIFRLRAAADLLSMKEPSRAEVNAFFCVAIAYARAEMNAEREATRRDRNAPPPSSSDASPGQP
jgi:hypothetical protein